MFSYKGSYGQQIEKDNDKFKRRVAKPDSEIFLYSAGVIGLKGKDILSTN